MGKTRDFFKKIRDTKGTFHTKRRLYMWTSPDGQHWNEIDYILCSQRWRSSIQLAKTKPEADCGSDHELLIAKFRLIILIVVQKTIKCKIKCANP